MPDRVDTDREQDRGQGRDCSENGRIDIATCEADVEQPTAEISRRGRTFEAFRYRDYSLFWSGAVVSNTGTWMQNAALAIVVYQFRRSELDIGLVNFLIGVPALFLALPAGVLADRIDKRRLIIWSQAALMLQAAALGFLYASGRLSSANLYASLAWVALLSVVAGVFSALTFPAWQAMLPELVPRETLLNAIALNSAQFQSARMIGPLIAGVVILALGAAAVFYINAVSFLFVIGALWFVHASFKAPARPSGGEPESAWTRLAAGLRYARGHTATRTIIISTALLTVFAFPYVILMPAIADKALGFHTDKANSLAYTYLLTANGLGALVGSLAVASLPHGVKRERLMKASLLAMALLLIAFSFSRSLVLSCILSACAGGALLTTNSLANTSIQASVPGHLRGRVMSLFVMAFLGIMPISGAVFGPIGQAIGPTNAVFAGALLLLVWALVLYARPQMLPDTELPPRG